MVKSPDEKAHPLCAPTVLDRICLGRVATMPEVPAQVVRTGALPALDILRQRTDAMAAELVTLVECESPSGDPAAVAACADLVVDLMGRWTGLDPINRVVDDGHTHLVWGAQTPDVVLVGHLDTVWPRGTIDKWPASAVGDRLSGPGVFDMKSGLVQMVHALSLVDDLSTTAVVITSDEEIGSPTSRELILDTANGARACLVLEASAAGKLKTARKGYSRYLLRAHGRAAHAGLEPEAGANAGIALALAVPKIVALSDPAGGTTVTPTLLRAGNTSNTVPSEGEVHIDVRTFDPGEQHRVHRALIDLRSEVEDVTFSIHGGVNRGPLTPQSSAGLAAMAHEVAFDLGIEDLGEAHVGGGSDGNFTAAAGVPTLDGLGAVGDLAHAEGEWASISAMPERAALVHGLITRLASR